jgi:hypothetical protein
MTKDQRHLRMLSIAHYVLGVAMTVFLLLFGAVFAFAIRFFYLVTTRPEMFSKPVRGGPPPVAFLAFCMSLMFFIFLSWAFTVVGTMLAGRYLAAQKHYVLCIVIAALNCAHIPFGALLGIFTIIVLARPSVRALFTANASVQTDVGVTPT